MAGWHRAPSASRRVGEATPACANETRAELATVTFRCGSLGPPLIYHALSLTLINRKAYVKTEPPRLVLCVKKKKYKAHFCVCVEVLRFGALCFCSMKQFILINTVMRSINKDKQGKSTLCFAFFFWTTRRK